MILRSWKQKIYKFHNRINQLKYLTELEIVKTNLLELQNQSIEYSSSNQTVQQLTDTRT